MHAKVNQAYGYVGGIVNLTCEAVAEPAANFTWYRQHKKTMPGRIIEQPHFSILQVFFSRKTLCFITQHIPIILALYSKRYRFRGLPLQGSEFLRDLRPNNNSSGRS